MNEAGGAAIRLARLSAWPALSSSWVVPAPAGAYRRTGTPVETPPSIRGWRRYSG